MPDDDGDLVHAPLRRWARERGELIALDDGDARLSFGALDAELQRRAASLAGAGATVRVDASQGLNAELLQFLAVIASGRCAAVTDPAWPAAMQDAVDTMLAAESQAAPAGPTPDAPFYVGFTSGSSGRPKGFRRSHASWAESFRLCLQAFGPEASARVMAPGNIAHSLFLFGMLLGLWTGGGTVVQQRFHAGRALERMRAGDVGVLVAVPTQLLLMLEWAARRPGAPIDGVRLVLISGARWARSRTDALRALFPRARIVEFYGASETSFIAWQEADPATPPEVVGRPFPGVELDIRERAPDGTGLIYVRSPMLFRDYLGEPDPATAARREGDWLSVRDMGWIDAQGRLCLAGRQQRMIVTQGKNLFPDEVEARLCLHPSVERASVHGLRDSLRGQQIVAVLRLAPHPPASPAVGEGACAAAIDPPTLGRWCRETLEAYKLPRQYWLCDDWPLTATGKTDYPALQRRLDAAWAATGSTPPWPARLP